MKPEHFILLSAIPMYIYILIPHRKLPYAGKDFTELTLEQWEERRKYLKKKKDKFFAIMMIWFVVVCLTLWLFII